MGAKRGGKKSGEYYKRREEKRRMKGQRFKRAIRKADMRDRSKMKRSDES